MSERLASGVPGLDQVLGGGLPADAINLIVGLPGTGKTLLAQQYVFENATAERPAVYLSTTSEPLEKVVRYGQTLGFFDNEAVGRRVLYEDLGGTLIKNGIQAALERVKAVLDERDPMLLVVDSFKPLATLADSRAGYRRFLHELAARLSIRPISSFWLGEWAVNEMASSPEFAIADAVIWLSTGRYEQREIRLLQVLKLRGSGFLTGSHAYRLSAEGMRVFPRLADRAEQAVYGLEPHWVSSGVKTLDTLLGHGFRAGSATLVVGPSGAGKTVLGLQFAFAGARQRDPTVFATFDENPSQLATTAANFGWSIEMPEIRLMYRSAVDLHLDEWVYELLETVESQHVRRVFIDGLVSLRTAAHDPTRFQEYLYSLVQRFARQGVTLMMSLESPELFGLTRLPDTPLSQISDNVLLLQFVRRDSEYQRALTVLKNRAARSEPSLTRYAIGASGIELRQPGPPARSR
ncbi:MAG TPA: ATPase domain-containing protein [Solirubrobacteraceae bacterium]